MKLKVCGMKYSENILEVAALAPDFMGFIFYTASKRYVGDDFAMPVLPSSIKKVGVFVNDVPAKTIETVKQHALDLVQLHGGETPAICKEIRRSAPVIKAFGIDSNFDFFSLNEFDNCCDYFLFDTKTQEYGGSGRSFDLRLLQKYDLSKPFFISGGLDMAAVPGILSHVPPPFAIDVNSKFETEPGRKDVTKLKIFKDEVSGKR